MAALPARDETRSPAAAREVFVAIVGSGFAGLAVAIELRKAGIDDLVVLERAATLGGTWRDNRYPGCACDVPSHLYSFSFAPKADWERVYAPQPEIRAYLERCADAFDVRRHIVFEREVVEARFDEDASRWRLSTRDGAVVVARALVLATGALSNPEVPPLPGLERFRGAVLHSARWDPGCELRGKRVAIVGTGASAIQIVPRLQPDAAKLYVVQRTPPWILPRKDRAYGGLARGLLARVPGLRWLYRQYFYWRLEGRVLAFVRHPALMRLVALEARRHLARSVRDPGLRALVTPRYTPGCKRILLSDDYYPALQQPNVEVIAGAVASAREDGVVLASGPALEVDAIVFCTGFRVHDYLGGLLVRGRGGESLRERWREEGAQAYLGTAVAGFPNLFIMAGPNTGLAHSSVVAMIEAQARYARQAISLLRDGVAELEPKADVQAAYNRWLRGRLGGAVWSSGCRSWYLDPQGRNTALWPGSVTAFRARTRRLRLDDFALRRTARSAGARPPA